MTDFPRRMSRALTTKIATGALMLSVANTAVAQEVLLTSPDGSISISGQLLGFEEGFYTLRSSVGTMRISSDSVECEGDACPDLNPGDDLITLAGEQSIGENLMPLLLAGYAGTQGGISETENGDQENIVLAKLVADEGFGDSMGQFSIESTGSGGAFRALLDRSAQIGMAARRIAPAEARRLRDAGAGNMIDLDQEHIVAVDSLIVMINQRNPVENLSLAQLDAIYSGNLTNWAELGGPNAPINVYAQPEESASAQTFEAAIFAESGRRRSGSVEEVGSDSAMANAINSDPNGIGYVGYAFQRGGKAVSITGTCGIISRPNAFTAKTEEYPLQRRLYLYNRADTLSTAGQNLIAYATSGDADSVIAKSGFIDLGVDRISMEVSEGRMENVIRSTIDPLEFGLMRDLLVDFLDYDRLSTTFRFASGSSRLDGKGLADLERLIEYLETQPEGTEVALVGFTDSDGAFDANRALSFGRAQQVAVEASLAAGQRLSNVNFVVKGYGELAPATCNDTLDGKRINRRVEVWIKKRV